MLFFVISGAELNLEILAQSVTIIVGIIYILPRSAGTTNPNTTDNREEAKASSLLFPCGRVKWKQYIETRKCP